VVVADDHALFRSGLRDLLTEHGFEVVGEAASGEDALAIVLDTAPDVVVMDLNMPGDGGIDTTKRIQEASPATRVIVLTVSAEEGDVNGAILAGACGYVLKEASTNEIAAAVAAAARGEALLSAPIAAGLLSRIRGDAQLADPGTPGSPRLTDRELEVLRLVAEGMDNAQISDELRISPQTVKNHVSNVLAKLQVENRIQAAVVAVRRRLV
jgi:DNA-binding NarL/FixJ family response regulator